MTQVVPSRNTGAGQAGFLLSSSPDLAAAMSWPAHTMVPDSLADLPDDEAPLVAPARVRPFSGTRLADGRALAWAEFGNPRGVPCIVIPDSRSSRLAPSWLLHDSALPDSVRLLSLDRPGIGKSDPVAPGRREDLAADISMLIHTLAVGSVVMIGIGSGIAPALETAERHPRAVTQVLALDARTAANAGRDDRRGRRPWSRSRRTAGPWRGALDAWERAAGGADLTQERSWIHARTRMSDEALRALGGRWLEADFRDAVAADVAETPALHAADTATPPPRWVREWAGRTPVHFWQSESDAHTSADDLRAVAAGRPGWQVTAVPGASPLFDCWPTMLTEATQVYLAATAR